MQFKQEGLENGPILITDDGEELFVAIRKGQWLRVFGYLQENGLAKEE